VIGTHFISILITFLLIPIQILEEIIVYRKQAQNYYKNRRNSVQILVLPII